MNVLDVLIENNEDNLRI